MKRFLIVFTVLVGMTLSASFAVGNSHPLPEHPHILVQRPVVELYDFGDPIGVVPAVVGVRKCIDLAGNNALKLGSQHHNVHFGNAGEKLFDKAGHVVAPTAPFPGVPWANCAEFLEEIPFPLPPED